MSLDIKYRIFKFKLNYLLFKIQYFKRVNKIKSTLGFTMANETYLGDGVYADCDGFHIILTTGGSVDNTSPQKIYLDCHTLHALKLFALSKGFSFKGDEVMDE